MKRSIILSLTLSLLAPLGVLAAAVTVENDTTVTMTGGNTFTMNSGSKFESMTVNESSVDYSLNTDGVLFLTSGTRAIFSVSGVDNVGRSTVCNTGNSTIEIRHDVSTTTSQTANVSYATTGCPAVVTSSSSGSSSANGPIVSSGGGGGGSVPPAPTPTPSSSLTLVEQLRNQIAAISAQIAALKGVPALPPQASPMAQIKRALALGSKGADVTALQTFLAKDTSVYPEGVISGYFGKLTEQAVKRFQKKYGIDQLGITGPKTRAKLNQLMSQ